MAKYSANNELGGTQQNLTTTYKTILSLTAETASLTSGKLYDLAFGQDGTPADNGVEWDVSRQTAAGTATVVTPTLLDPSSRAAGTIAEANYTAEGTITANSSVFYLPLNQRASYRWVAAPGSELLWPATDEAGLAIRAKSPSYSGTVGATAFFEE